MNKVYEKEIEVPEEVKFEMVGRACLFFAKTYPKNDEALWWKIPESIEIIARECYRQGFASGANIKEINPNAQKAQP